MVLQSGLRIMGLEVNGLQITNDFFEVKKVNNENDKKTSNS